VAYYDLLGGSLRSLSHFGEGHLNLKERGVIIGEAGHAKGCWVLPLNPHGHR